MAPNEWSRRDLLKTAATGAVGLGLAGVAVSGVDRSIVGATEADAVSAAASFSDHGHRTIELGPDMTLVAGVFSRATRSTLLAREDVRFVEPDRRLQAPPPSPDGDVEAGRDRGSGSDGSDRAAGQTLPWGIDRVDAEVAHDAGETGDGAHVAVIDTGIDDEHPDLADNLADPDGDGNHRAWQECSGDGCTHPWSDDGDHGTHVSGTVAAGDGSEGVVGVAPEATLHALKVCDGAGFCRTSDIVEAIRYAADQDEWDVANLSLGSPEPSEALEAAGEYAAENGLLLVAAAGNRGCSDCVGYPAAYDEYLAVSATTIEDGVAEFSSTGPEVGLAAPGQDVCSAVVGGHDVFDGTSMASPHVAGAAAQLMADGLSAGEAREQLLATAEDIGHDEPAQGSGLVDAAAALGLDSGDDGTGDGTSCPS